MSIHVDRRPGRPLTFADTNGEPILAYDAEKSEVFTDAEGRPMPRGWTLYVEHYSPFAMGVRDFDSVDEALAKATRTWKRRYPTRVACWAGP